MEEEIREPQIKRFFKEENLCMQNVYKSKEEYKVVYINQELYEEIFHEKYVWEDAKQKISTIFSITLDEKKSDNKIIGKAYSDKQADPTGMALSGNLGSGRSYFFDKNFNIKGDKTKLATSPKSIYNNGKYALSASIKETVIANILAKDFVVPTFETLAILETGERFEFLDEYLDFDDQIKNKTYNLPCSIEIRVNKEKELYRISNSLINNDKYTEEEIENFCKKLAKIEANKFCDRFLHGSWSVGNISTEGNLIDFDTSSFVKGRFPQYSNTNKYKSNYFGYELLGQKIMINSISNNEKLEKIMNDEYEKNIKIKFCDLIGLDYNLYYLKYYKYIDSLSKKFNILSRKFLANYYDTNIANQNENITYLFDFSRFFQKYLIYREKGNKFINGIKLLFNDPQYIEYEKVGMIKEKVDEFFEKDIVNDDNMDKYVNEAMDFIQEYDELFEEIEKEQDLQEIKLKQYFINADRNYLYSKKHIFGKIAYKYDIKEIDDKTINIIINSLIKANIRNHYNIECKNILGLRLYKDFLTYWIVTKNYYYLVIEPFSKFDIEFAKLSLNGEEFMIKHRLDEEGAMESEKIEFDSLPDILNFDVKIKINGKEYNGEFDQI